MIRIQVDGQGAPTGLFPTILEDPYGELPIAEGSSYAQVPVGLAAVSILNSSPDGTGKGYQVTVRNISTGGQVISFGTNGAVTTANGGIVLNPTEAYTFDNIQTDINAIASAAAGNLAVFILKKL